MRKLLALLQVGLLVAVAGCTSLSQYVHNGFKVGPNHATPAAAVADDWLDSSDARLTREPIDCLAWWQIFNDPVLDRVVALAYQQNITLREAGLRVAEAQAQRAVVAGALFPQTQDAFGEYIHTQRSTQTALFPRGAVPLGNFALRQFDAWRVGGSLAWELDFWGRFRRAIEAADARLDGSVENYHDALVLLIAEVATAYIDVRTLDQRLDFARNNADLQQESARVAEARLRAKAADSEVDAPQAKSNLSRTLAGIAALGIARRQAENRLAVLLGMPPQDLSELLQGEQPIPVAPDRVAIGVPADLLRRRPDVRRAERLVAAQCAEIGFAQTNLYPHISLNGALSLEAAQFSDMFNGGAWAGTVGPAFRWNVLNYGRLVNNVRVQDARLDAQIAIYQQTVLQANEEAENAIAAFLRTHEQVKHLQQSVQQAQEAVRVTQAKYRAGQIDFNRVFTVEALLVSQQDQYASVQGNLANSLIALYRALGGGWEVGPQPLEAEPQAAEATAAEAPDAPDPAATASDPPARL